MNMVLPLLWAIIPIRKPTKFRVNYAKHNLRPISTGDQLNMAVFFCPVYATVHVYTVQYTGQVTFSKVPKNTAMFNWSVTGHPVN